MDIGIHVQLLYFEDLVWFVFKYDFQLLEKTTTQAFAKPGLGHGY